MRHKLSIAAALCLLTACAPKLGDDCERTTDCSANGTRFCDVAQPGGYCTIRNCEPGTCGDEGHCVRFQPDEPRLSSNWCMAKCSSDRDCSRDAYVCRSTADLNSPKPGANATEMKRKAEILGAAEHAKFCVVRE